MHDFGNFRLEGLVALVRVPKSYKIKVPEKERLFLITGGAGCDPDPAYGRDVTGKWTCDNSSDKRNTFDFEYVIKDGKKIHKQDSTPKEESMPVESEPSEKKPVVRRKRG